MKLLILLTLLSTHMAWANKPILKVGFVPFAPYMNKSGNKYSGDVVQEVKRLYSKDYQIKWVEISFQKLLMALNQNQIDFFPILVKTKQREAFFKYSEKPIFYAQPVLCSNQPDFFKNQNKKFKVGVLKNSYITNQLNEKYDIVEVDINDKFLTKGFKFLMQKKFDAVYILDNKLIKGKRFPSNVSCEALKDKFPVHFVMKKDSDKTFSPTRLLD